ncbi:MAG: FMN-binding protein [Sphingomicrobium sp.]
MRPRSSWYAIAPVVLVAPASAHAMTYLTVAQAQRQMFPSASGFADRSVDFTPAQRKAIARASGTSAPHSQRIYEARDGGGRSGWLIIDQVLGKHEMISYALALAPDGAVRSVEILDYRETYGGEIRNPAWRRQFAGKRAGQSLKLGKDIHNISGATLSSRHVTDGVRRLLVTYQLLLAGG